MRNNVYTLMSKWCKLVSKQINLVQRILSTGNVSWTIEKLQTTSMSRHRNRNNIDIDGEILSRDLVGLQLSENLDHRSSATASSMDSDGRRRKRKSPSISSCRDADITVNSLSESKTSADHSIHASRASSVASAPGSSTSAVRFIRTPKRNRYDQSHTMTAWVSEDCMDLARYANLPQNGIAQGHRQHSSSTCLQGQNSKAHAVELNCPLGDVWVDKFQRNRRPRRVILLHSFRITRCSPPLIN